MLSDFFDTMGTVTGIAAEAGLADEDGSVPVSDGSCSSTRSPPAVGGFVGVSSNTTYIESGSRRRRRRAHRLTAVVTGVLFLLAILLSPLAGLWPELQTAPAPGPGRLSDVRPWSKDINVADHRGRSSGPHDDDRHAAHLQHHGWDRRQGFITWALLKIVTRKWRRNPPADGRGHSLAFVLYFAADWILVVWH